MAYQGAIGAWRSPRFYVKALSTWPNDSGRVAVNPDQSRSSVPKFYLRKGQFAQSVTPADVFNFIDVPNDGSIIGTVVEAGSTPVPNAIVRLYHRETGLLLETTRSDSSGNFAFYGYDNRIDLGPDGPLSELYYVVCFDPAGGNNYNALIFDQVVPYWDPVAAGISSRTIAGFGFDGSVMQNPFGVGGGFKWITRLQACTGTIKYAYEFEGNGNDQSGNGYNGTNTGGMSYTSDDPSLFVPTQQAANFTGSNYYTINNNANVVGNADRSCILIVKPSLSTFISSSTLMTMGGSDSGSSGAFRSFGVGFAGSSGAPTLRLDWTRDVNDFTFPLRFVGVWIAIIVTHTAGSQIVRAAVLGVDSSWTTIGTSTRNLSTNQISGVVGNWIGQWNNARRYVGAMAFLGMIDTVLSSTDRDRFLFP